MHEKYMKIAIEEAKKGMSNTFTNPLVGAVIVKDGHILSRGAHLEYGYEHAEHNAISKTHSPEDLLNSTLYVTLEPCAHFGKQPPCTQLIVQSGIKTVVIGQLDPNPIVRGKGVDYLEENGIEVIIGINEKDVRQLNSHYNFMHENSRPYIVLKQSITLDGKITMNDNQRTSITDYKVWEAVHEERGNYHGIVVGSETVLTDNPTLLTTKNTKFPPVRIILDRRGRTLNKELNIFEENSSKVLIFTEANITAQLPPHVEVIKKQQLSLPDVINLLAERNIQSLYVEGGGRLHDSFLENELWDEVFTYISPKIFGGKSLTSFRSNRTVKNATTLKSVQMEKIGEDFKIVGKR